MASSGTGAGSPCGACKFLRRKCVVDCVFAPYFSSEESTARFAAMHKVFGASNVSKVLLHVPVQERYEVVITMAYEAEARLHDPVYGCVSHIFALQQQVAFLQAQMMHLKEDIRNRSNTAWQQTSGHTIPYKPYSHENPNKPVSPQSSRESMEHVNTSTEVTNTYVQEIQNGRLGFYQDGYPNKKRSVSYCNSDLGELHVRFGFQDDGKLLI